MTAQYDSPAMSGEAVFQWHPEYKGRTVDAVRRELETEIARDQRSYELALLGAEDSEHDALASVVDLERRWSTYDFGWHEADARALARRIVEFEWAREQQQEMISWNAYRSSGQTLAPTGRASGDWRANMSDDQRRRVANIIAGILVALILLLVIALVAVVVL